MLCKLLRFLVRHKAFDAHSCSLVGNQYGCKLKTLSDSPVGKLENYALYGNLAAFLSNLKHRHCL